MTVGKQVTPVRTSCTLERDRPNPRANFTEDQSGHTMFMIANTGGTDASDQESSSGIAPIIPDEHGVHELAAQINFCNGCQI